ncbi:NAC domain-containing protein 90 [Tripterygium wilfordii]|uniref:NAC domain-containing protein 90 n=1 Tax=Tripterygium wilfordii TaxID=458696 RepID=A0A7J7C0B3_TRIWF|nr:NAC domain-containing protein 90 [Tripterygium wilfordii]KAF5727538.1 NAC domain-containing protein 90 [Tripterygium wilfordii]
MQAELPVGFRFYPTEEELVSFYLHNKLQGNIEDQLHRVIPCINIYDVEPWHLPRLSAEVCKGSTDWFFFTPRQEREAKGGRPSRTTATGYWKATGSPGWVFSSNNRVIGVRKSMVFYQGKAPHGKKTKWKMNDYIAIDEASSSSSSSSSSPTAAIPKLRQEFRLCRLYVGSGSARAFDRRPSEAPMMRMMAEDQQNIHDARNQEEGARDPSTEIEGGENLESANDIQEDDWEQLNWVEDPEFFLLCNQLGSN